MDQNSIIIDRYLTAHSSNNIAVGILDISRDISNKHIQKRTFDMTYFYINRMTKFGACTYVGFENKVSALLEHADKNHKKYCMIACQGLILFRGPTLVNKMLDYADQNPNFFVVGHIMDKATQKKGIDCYPGLHRQYLFVNVEKWKELGKPEFDEIGIYKDRKPLLTNYEMSEDTVYSNYTPAWIKSAEGEKEYMQTADGSNWIDIALRNNIKIDNLKTDMRDCKVFLYPYSDTEKLAKVWYNKQISEINQLTNQSQKAWMRKLAFQEEIERDRVYVFNTEILSGEVKYPTVIDHFFTVAAGFKPLAILNANGFHKNTVINYFDWCEASINYKKHLLETWDGYDLHLWLEEHESKYNFASTFRGNYKKFWEKECSEHGGREKFKNLWDKYKELKHNFYVIDIVNEPEKLFEKVHSCNGAKVMWTTNIWSSEMLHWNVEPEELEEKCLKFQKLIPEDLIFYGHDYLGIQFDDRIKDGKNPTHPRFQTIY